MGDRPDDRHDYARQRSFQREVASREAHEQGWQRAFADAERRCFSRARQRQHDVLLLPHFVDAPCFGCHLQMTANARKPMLHNEGLVTKNYTSYNFQVLRDDIYMLGVDGTVTGHRIAPARSSCAVLVSSQNANRDWLYYTQQTISTPGFSGQAFSTFVPHTVRAKETKQCSDCHVSAQNDNNAW